MSATCETCRWWDAEDMQRDDIGVCRGDGPRVHLSATNDVPMRTLGFWPTTHSVQYCRHHEPNVPERPQPGALDEAALRADLHDQIAFQMGIDASIDDVTDAVMSVVLDALR